MALYFQCSAPTFSREIATIRLRDGYRDGKKTWRATLKVKKKPLAERSHDASGLFGVLCG
jgi:hypothetical protein